MWFGVVACLFLGWVASWIFRVWVVWCFLLFSWLVVGVSGLFAFGFAGFIVLVWGCFGVSVGFVVWVRL